MPPKSGMDLMAGMLGLGPLMKTAQQLVDSGAVDKILRFADEVAIINERLARIERILASIANGPDGQPGCGGATGGIINGGRGIALRPPGSDGGGP